MLGNSLAENMLDKIRDVEKDIPLQALLRNQIKELSDLLEMHKGQRDTFKIENENEVHYLQSGLKTYERIVTNREYLTLKHRMDEQNCLPPGMAQKLQSFIDRLSVIPQFSDDSFRQSADQKILEYDRLHSLHTQNVEKLLSQISEKEKELKTLISDRRNRPIEWQWNAVLASFDIAFQQSYTMQLVGEHIYRLMNNYEDILVKTKELIIANIFNSKINQTADSVTKLFYGFTKLFDLLYFINSVMTSMDKIDEETLSDVEDACCRYGNLYRLHFEKDAPPKIHLLEVHLVRKLRIFLRVGPNREDPIEHEHQIQHRERVKASNIRNYLHQQQMMDRRIGASYIPTVSAFMNSMTSKRVFSAKTLEIKTEKEEIESIEKKQRLYKWKNLNN
jgi:hypothetical protein